MCTVAIPRCTVAVVVGFQVVHRPRGLLSGGLWAAAAGLLLTNWELKPKHKAQTPLQLFTERPRDPGQSCCVYERGTFGCFPLWHRKECVEAETDRRMMDGGKNRRRGVSLVLVSPSRRLFGEFADDANKSSIFIL